MCALGNGHHGIPFKYRVTGKNNLVTKEKGVYRLTLEGELFVQKSFPALLMEKFQGDTDGYLQNRNLDFIPLYLLERLHNIESYIVIQPNYVDIFDHNKEAHEAFKSSKTFKMIATGVRPHLFELLKDMVDNKVDLSIIFDPRLLAKLQKDSLDELQELFNKRQVKIYRYPHNICLVSLKLSELCIVLQLLKNDGTYDYTQIMSYSPKTIAWGQELFDYYLKTSTLITEVNKLL